MVYTQLLEPIPVKGAPSASSISAIVQSPLLSHKRLIYKSTNRPDPAMSPVRRGQIVVVSEINGQCKHRQNGKPLLS